MSDEPVVLYWWGEALSWMAALLLFPVFWFIALLLVIYRFLAFLLTGVRMTHMTGIDTVLAQDLLSPVNMISLVTMLDRMPDVDDLLDCVQRNVLDAKVEGGTRKRFPKFSCFLEFQMGFPVWREAGDVRAADHFYEHPVELGSLVELEAVVNERCNRHMRPGRPAWDSMVIKLKDGWRSPHYDGETVPRCAFILRCHHIYADGVSLIRILCEAMFSNSGQVMDAMRERLGNIKQLRRQAMGRLAVSSTIILLTGIILVPYYFFRLTLTRDRGLLRSDRVRTGRKHFCWSHPVPLARIKAIKEALSTRTGLNITINDVVMSCVAGALRHFLSARKEHLPEQVKACIPVNVQSMDKPVTGDNKLVMLMVGLAIGVSDPVKRVLASKRVTDQMKTSVVDWMMNDLIVRSAIVLPRLVIATLSKWLGGSLFFSNVPGPTVPVMLLGCQLTDAFAFVPNTKSIGLTVAFQSYIDHVTMTVTMDKGLSEDIEDARGLIKGVLDELDILETQQTLLETRVRA